MGKVICSKCGMTGTSKCPHQRNVFMDNQMEALLSNVICFDYHDEKKPKYDMDDKVVGEHHQLQLKVTVNYYGNVDYSKADATPPEGWTDEMKVDVWKSLAKHLQLMLESDGNVVEEGDIYETIRHKYDVYPTLEQWACHHNIQHVAGTHKCGFCGQENVA